MKPGDAADIGRHGRAELRVQRNAMIAFALFAAWYVGRPVLNPFHYVFLRDVILATHEAGHVLGIDHSEDSTALMAGSYADGLLTSRGLGPDDVDAICALFPPARTALECPVPVVRDEALDPVACGHLTEESGCALVAPGRRSSVSGLALFALVLALWVRVRRRAV